MTSTERDVVSAVQQVIASWEPSLVEAETGIEEIRASSLASSDSLRHQMEDMNGRHATSSTQDSAEVAEVRQAVRELHLEVSSARAHVDQVYDRLAHELGAWRSHLRELHDHLHAPVGRVDQAIDHLHGVLDHTDHETTTALDGVQGHLAHGVPTATHALDGDLAGALENVGQRAASEWLPAIQGAVHDAVGVLDRVASQVEQHTHAAHEESHNHVEQTVNFAESRSHEHHAHSHERARSTADSLRQSAQGAHALGATVITGTEALHSASEVCNSGLSSALGVLRAIEQLFSHLG